MAIAPPQATPDQLQRGLKARHLNMIAIGGAIGTGLFVASGSSISTAGPGGALLAYAAIGFMVFLLMQSLGEMATYLPVAGSFGSYGARFVSPSFGFATGWNYWYNWAITVAAELVAAALVMKYWLPDVPAWVWSAIFLSILVGLNSLSARSFGESEFWFASIKVITVIIFLIVGVAMIVGVLAGPSPGFSNWGIHEAPFSGGVMGVVAIFMIAGFSFQGTELIGVAAGEAEEPEKNVPRAIRAVFFRIMLFYIGAIAVIGFLIPYTHPNLLANDVTDIAISPFTLVFERAGVLAAASIMNAVILTSILSAGNSGMYASTRMLYSLAVEGSAPKMFAKLNANGVPRNALYATTLIGALCFFTSIYGEKTVYLWLLNTSGMTGFIAWLGIAVCHYRFRKAYVAQGRSLAALPYRATLFPLGPLFAFALCLAITLGQNYQAFMADAIDWSSVAATYIGIPLFFIIWFGYRLKNGTRLLAYDEIDLDSDRDTGRTTTIVDDEDDFDEDGGLVPQPAK